MFNKGGSTLLSLTLKSFCDWKGIEITDELGDGDIVAVVRNPINRFYSGFIHQLIWHKGGESNFDWKELSDRELEDRLWHFLDYCKEGEKKEDIDFHYARQSYILESNGYYSRNLKLHQIEYIHPQIEEAGMIRGISSNLDYRSVQPLISSPKLHFYLELIGDLGLEFEGWDSHFFIASYHLFKSGLEGGHHKREAIPLKAHLKGSEVEKAIEEWLERDTQMFEYNTQLANERKTNL